MSKMFEIIETQDMISDFFKQKRNLNNKLKRIASRSNERNKGAIPLEAQQNSLIELTQSNNVSNILSRIQMNKAKKQHKKSPSKH